METQYRDINIYIEPSILNQFTYDMLFWPVGGSRQFPYARGMNATTPEQAIEHAIAYAERHYDLILAEYSHWFAGVQKVNEEMNNLAQ